MAMTLSEYIADTARRAQLARDVMTSTQYLYQLATSWRGKRASPRMAQAIERATAGAVSRSDLRPDIWPDVVPDPHDDAALPRKVA